MSYKIAFMDLASELRRIYARTRNFVRHSRSHSRAVGRLGVLARCQSGQSLVELALVLPIMLTFVFGLMEICLAFYTHAYISELSREGTRYAIFHGSTCETSAGASCAASTTASDATSVVAYVKGIGLPNLGGGTLNPVVNYLDSNSEAPGSRVQVSITYRFPYNIPFIPASTLSMSSSSTMYIIQ
jgi:Flp pilus assembly protein TadG